MMKRRRNSATGDMRHGGDPSADAALAKMGYQSELPRNLSMMSVLGLYVSLRPSPPGVATIRARWPKLEQQLLIPKTLCTPSNSRASSYTQFLRAAR
jgi:hypothetical protein